MEGKNSDRRQKAVNLFPALLLQASRYVLTYRKAITLIDNIVLGLSFEQYIKERDECIKEVARWLDIDDDGWNAVSFERFQINTSYVKKKAKKKLPNTVELLIP